MPYPAYDPERGDTKEGVCGQRAVKDYATLILLLTVLEQSAS